MILMAAALLCCVHCWVMQSLFFEKFRRCAIDVVFVRVWSAALNMRFFDF
jgi:hypothetical protein